MNRNMRLVTKALVLAALVCIVAVPAIQAGQSDAAPSIVPPDGTYAGQSYADWAAAFWQWAYSYPNDETNPMNGNVGAGQDDHRVYFLPGIWGGGTRAVTVKSWQAIFFPLINNECSTLEPPPFQGVDQQSLAACANANLKNYYGLYCDVDGQRVRNLGSYREQTPMFAFLNLPNPNLGGPGVIADPSKTYYSVDAGFFIMLEPLKLGKHVIKFGGCFDPAFGWGCIDSTYIVNVIP